MYRVFALTPAVSLRSRSPLIYQSGDYHESIPGVWTGRIDRIRIALPSQVQQDSNGAYQFKDFEVELQISQSTSVYAYYPDVGLLLYMDRAEIPYTRIPSYIQGALGKASAVACACG